MAQLPPSAVLSAIPFWPQLRLPGNARHRRRESNSSVSQTLPGKLPSTIVRWQPPGYSSYGNRLALLPAKKFLSSITQATLQKRMEIGAVVGATPRRERPEDGDIIVLLGGHWS